MCMPDRDRDELTEQHRLSGPAHRPAGRTPKVTGTATFSAEYPVEESGHAALAYSTIAKGAIKSIDTSAAGKAPGVHQCYHAPECAEDESSQAVLASEANPAPARPRSKF